MGVVWVLALTAVVCLLMALVVLDRVGFTVSGRSWLPWRRNDRSQAALSSGLDQVTALFYATKHYELEQRKTEFVLREDPAQGAPRRFALDLDLARPPAGGQPPAVAARAESGRADAGGRGSS